MDDAAAIALLDDFLGLLAQSRAIYDMDHDGYYQRPQWQEAQDRINASLVGVRRVAEHVESNLLNGLVANTQMYTWEWGQAQEAAMQLRGAIAEHERVDAILKPTGPRLAAAELHPWVWNAAAQLWDDGHRRAAIQTASSAINAQLQAKLNRYDISDAHLVTEAFRLDGTGMRLRFGQYPPASETYRSAHEGR